MAGAGRGRLQRGVAVASHAAPVVGTGCHGVAARVGMARKCDPDRVAELGWRQGKILDRRLAELAWERAPERVSQGDRDHLLLPAMSV